MSANKIYFTVITQLQKNFDFNFWAYDGTTVNDIEYKFPNEFMILRVNNVKYICFVPFNIDSESKLRAAVNVSTAQDLDATIKIRYNETEIEMEEGFIYRCNEEDGFDEIAIPEGISYRSYKRNPTKISFELNGHMIFNEPIYSTFANGDKLIINEFYYAFDERRKPAIYQKFILRETESDYRYILLKRFSPGGANRKLRIGCSIGNIIRSIYPSNIIIGYQMKGGQFGIKHTRLGFIQEDDNQFSVYAMESLGMETIDVAGSIHLN
jgi:hypothetical protein